MLGKRRKVAKVMCENPPKPPVAVVQLTGGDTLMVGLINAGI